MAAEGGQVNVRISTFAGEFLQITAKTSDSVGLVKIMIRDARQVPEEVQRLFHGEMELLDAQNLGSVVDTAGSSTRCSGKAQIWGNPLVDSPSRLSSRFPP